MKKPKTDSEILRPNFGQHTPAIDELLKLLSQTTRYRNSTQDNVNRYRKDLEDAEQRLADYNLKIESYKSAVRVLGGKVSDDYSEQSA